MLIMKLLKPGYILNNMNNQITRLNITDNTKTYVFAFFFEAARTTRKYDKLSKKTTGKYGFDCISDEYKW